MKKKVFMAAVAVFVAATTIMAEGETPASKPAKNAAAPRNAFQTAMYLRIDSTLFLPECERQLMQITSKSAETQTSSRAMKFLDSLLLVVAKTDRINVAVAKAGGEKSYLVFDLYGTVDPEDITQLFELMRDESDASQPEYVIEERPDGFLVVTLEGSPVFTMINGRENSALDENILRVVFSPITSAGCEVVKLDAPIIAPKKALTQCKIDAANPMWFVTCKTPAAGDAAAGSSAPSPQQIWMQTDPKTFVATLYFRFAFTRDAESVFEQLVTRKNDEPILRLTGGFLTDLRDIQIDSENPCVIKGKLDINNIIKFIITSFNRVCGEDKKNDAAEELKKN